MAGRVEGKVAFITGAARGQGRSHAIRLAQEGADIIAVDLCAQVASVPYAMSTPAAWQDTLDTNLTGVWNTMVVSVPHLIAAGGGSIICTSSTAGIKGLPYLAPYVAAKHGVVGIARTMANELAAHKIRVNTVHPTGVDTPMGSGLGGLEPLLTRDPNLGPIFMNTLPVEKVDPRDISNAVLFLASDEARYVTGLEFTVDAGNTIR